MTEIIIGGVLLLTAVLIIIAFSNRLICREYEIKTEKISGEIKAVHISDLHESRFGKNQEVLLDSVKKEQPDIILITGDMIEDDDESIANGKTLTYNNPAYILLDGLAKIAPCYMVLGNHESNIPNTDKLCEQIEKLGIHVFHRPKASDADMSAVIEINSEKILICGADDPYFYRCEPCHKKTLTERVTEDKNRETPLITRWREYLSDEYGDVGHKEVLTVLLSHRPEEYELYKKLGFDVVFSGHAHGGQWRLPPFINGVYAPHQGLFPKHAGGCYRYNKFIHVVSRGLSKKRMVRIFNRPEICLVRFIGKKEYFS